MGDASKDAAQSAVRAAKLRARAMAEKERTNDYRAWHLRDAAGSTAVEDVAAAVSRSVLAPGEGGSVDSRTSALISETHPSHRPDVANSTSESQVPATSVPTDDELAVLASAFGGPQQSASPANHRPREAGAVEDPARQSAMMATPVDPAVESAAAAALDVDPQHLRVVFEAAHAASAGSPAGTAAHGASEKRPQPPSQSAFVSAPDMQPQQQKQDQDGEDDMGDGELCKWEQDHESTTGGIIFANNSPGIDMTSKTRRTRDSFGIELTNSNLAQLQG